MRHETMRLLSRLKPAHLELRISLWWEPDAERAHGARVPRRIPTCTTARIANSCARAMKYAHARGG